MKEVGTIRDPEKLKWIREDLAARDDPLEERRFLLFTLGIFTGLRISDLVRLRVENVIGDNIRTIEKKTRKEGLMPLAQEVRDIIQDRVRGMSKRALLFPSREKDGDGKEKHIVTRTAYRDMQIIANRYGLRGSIGCHTLRKTFGYWHYKKNHDLEMLRAWFNHSSVEVTRRYIGIDYEERRKSVQGFNPGGAIYKPRGSIVRGRPKEESVPMEIERQDREKQGRIMGQKAQEARERKRKKS